MPRDTGSRPRGAGRTRVLFVGVRPLTHPILIPDLSRTVPSPCLAPARRPDGRARPMAEEVAPPPRPWSTPRRRRPFPATVDVGGRPAPSDPAGRGPARRGPAGLPAAQPAYQSGDPYGFTAWLNGVRAQYGLGPVGFDPNLSSWAAVNNGQQQARGMGHHVMGPARRQNSGWATSSTVCQMWMASPAHQAALLDPTITWIGIAGQRLVLDLQRLLSVAATRRDHRGRTPRIGPRWIESSPPLAPTEGPTSPCAPGSARPRPGRAGRLLPARARIPPTRGTATPGSWPGWPARAWGRGPGGSSTPGPGPGRRPRGSG